jgi:hypothetical protein
MLSRTSVTPDSGLTPLIAMLKPCCANWVTMPNPIPLLPPVIRATFAIVDYFAVSFGLSAVSYQLSADLSHWLKADGSRLKADC